LKKEIEKLRAAKAGDVKSDLMQAFEQVNGVKFLAAKVPLEDASAIKNLAFQLSGAHDDAFVLLASEQEGKALLTLAISKQLVQKGALNAGAIIRELAKLVRGGGGGQPFFATAGGKDPAGIPAVLEAARHQVQ
jgi:alanyl-tRNA synthetase